MGWGLLYSLSHTPFDSCLRAYSTTVRRLTDMRLSEEMPKPRLTLSPALVNHMPSLECSRDTFKGEAHRMGSKRKALLFISLTGWRNVHDISRSDATRSQSIFVLLRLRMVSVQSKPFLSSETPLLKSFFGQTHSLTRWVGLRELIREYLAWSTTSSYSYSFSRSGHTMSDYQDSVESIFD
ncbi:hypothetical protein V6N13_057141 [Hibiscus sabdariffa]|uniref:Uncharacterized protein n=2 Tax=Hibiscus sabdariffa TaxID=183260 RepID=A0ABR2AEK2_9ROSI